MRALIIGCGYVGVPLGRLLKAKGWQVFGMRRSASADDELKAAGIGPVHGDVTEPGSLRNITPDFDLVVNLVSSSKGGLEEYRAVYLEGTRNVLEWLAARRPSLYIHASSTSVYGQADGSAVRETSPVTPQSATSQVLVEAEQVVLAAHERSRFPGVIVRLAGIYGPGRGHLFKQFLRGEAAMRGDGSSYINSIHLDDVAGAIAAVAAKGAAGEIYNIADDEPVTQQDFFKWLSRKLRKPMPPSAPPDAGRKRGLTNKRVLNDKLKCETAFVFRYPTFREGYSSEIERLRAEGHPDLQL